MGKFKDLTGMKFGKLTVLGIAFKKPRKPHGYRIYWKCRCECGNCCDVLSDNLTRDHTLSCGCLLKEISHKINYKHGLTHTQIYNVWASIKQRCFYSKSISFQNYGGRGITMFEDWINDFQAFYNYVSKLPHFGEEGYTLDRIDNNGNYEPNNIRWVTKKEQANNTRRNIIIEYQGKKMSLKEAANLSGIDYTALFERYKKGDTGERLFRPVRKYK